MQDGPSDTLLRRTLYANAAFSAAGGIAMAAGAGPLARLFGIAAPAVLVALGIAVVVFAAGVFWLARRPLIPALQGWIVVALDVTWCAASAVLLLAMPGLLSVPGRWAVGLVALAVALLAAFETAGVRRLTRASDNAEGGAVRGPTGAA